MRRWALAIVLLLTSGCLDGDRAAAGELPTEPPFTVATLRDCASGFCGASFLALDAQILYAVDSTALGGLNALVPIDVSDPANPVIGTPTDAPDYVGSIALSGDGTAYTALFHGSYPSGGIAVFDLSSALVPVFLASFDLTRRVEDLVVADDRLFVANQWDGLRIYDISDRANPVETAQLDAADLLAGASVEAVQIVIEGDLAFLGANTWEPGVDLKSLLAIIDIENPDAPVVIARYQEPRANSVSGSISDLKVVGDLVYLVKRGGLRILDVSTPQTPTRIGLLETALVYDDQLFEIEVRGDTAFIANWGLGMAVVDVSDPTTPSFLGHEPGDYPVSDSWSTRLAVGSGYAFLSNGRSGLQVIAVDADGDDRAIFRDNCPAVANQDQADSDDDGEGDACDGCPAIDFLSPDDSDADSWDDICDNCPAIFNPGQEDLDGDGVGDACNEADDRDGDELADDVDNCPDDPNADQSDRDWDGLGDPCDPFPDDADHVRAQLEADLAEALSEVASLEDELSLCLDRPLFEDADNDGEADATDACPGTAPSAPVDGRGCSIAQFCGSHTSGRPKAKACRVLDWRNDEPLLRWPRDCRPAFKWRKLGWECVPAHTAAVRWGHHE